MVLQWGLHQGDEDPLGHLVLDADQDVGDDAVADAEGEETWDRETDYDDLKEDHHSQSWDWG